MCEVVISAYSKALRDRSKALPAIECLTYDEQMLSTSNTSDLAERLRRALKATGMTQVEFAGKCGASKQAVHGWLKTGRIDKQRLLTFAEVAGTTIYALLGQPEPEGEAAPIAKSEHRSEERRAVYTLPGWPFASFTRAEYESLPAETRGIAEGFVRGLIAARQTKSNGTTGLP